MTTEVGLDLAGDLRVAIGRLARWLRRHDGSGLTPGQLSVLGVVYRDGPQRMTELAGREGVAGPTMTRLVDGLVELGVVQRVSDPDDARSSHVVVTDKGDAFIRASRQERESVLARRLDALSSAERAALVRALPALAKLAEDA